MAFHEHVEEIKKYYLTHFPEDKRSETAKKLTIPCDNIDLEALEKMWLSIQKAEEKRYKETLDDNLWVHCFIDSAYQASAFPPYYYKSELERNELIEEIEKLTKNLSKLLTANDLDFHLTHSTGSIFKGFSFYEDFGEKNQWYIDQEEDNKLPMSVLLPFLSRRLTEEISYAHTQGKAGKNVKQIRFIRALAKSNVYAYGSPLYSVIATASHAIYGTEGTQYSESDIANLLNRKSKKETPEQIIKRIATLPKSKYQRIRGAIADRFRISTSTLDDIIEKENKRKI